MEFSIPSHETRSSNNMPGRCDKLNVEMLEMIHFDGALSSNKSHNIMFSVELAGFSLSTFSSGLSQNCCLLGHETLLFLCWNN